MFARERRLQKPRALLPACQPLTGGTWVDVGSGDGVFAEGLLEIPGEKTRVIGFDRDRSKLSRLLTWAASHPAICREPINRAAWAVFGSSSGSRIRMPHRKAWLNGSAPAYHVNCSRMLLNPTYP